MRIIAFILALSVFYLSVLTCSDGMIGEPIAVEECTGAVDSHEHSHDGDDDCTPFCVCDCCGAFITVPKAFRFDVKEIQKNHLPCNSNFYSMNYKYNFNQGVWHPPTVC